MASEEPKTIYILRRMKREPLSIWAWNPYSPSSALPEELGFILLDENERNIGQLTYGQIKVLKGLDISTPWGPARMDWLKGRVRMALNGRELFYMKSKFFQSSGELQFPNGVTMEFPSSKGRKNDIEYSDDKGSVALIEEKGTLPEGHPGLKVQMTKDEIKRLPKKDRPRSTESRDYVQYRLKIGGTTPVDQEDLARGLVILAGYVCLIGEGLDQINV